MASPDLTPARHSEDAGVDAVVVGAGPNGLAAALTLAAAGLRVRVYEAAAEPGGGSRSAELTVPGVVHDVCATVQALAGLSPFFRGLDLASLGVELCLPEIPFAQPLDGGRAALAHRDLAATAAGLGRDGTAWRRLFAPLVARAEDLIEDVFADLRHLPRHPLLLSRFGVPALAPATALARAVFRDEPARALFAGVSAHSMRRLDAPLTSAFGMVLAVTAHSGGWPVVRGGSGRLVAGLVRRLHELGVEIECEHRVRSLDELPRTELVLLDVSPRQLAELAGPALPARYRAALTRFRYGPGVFKIDWVLREPVPWAAPEVRRAGTVHVGGTLAEIAASEADVEAGRHSERPYVLAVQASVADPDRGGHTLWGYCHVPSGSTLDRTAAVEAQIERFAPGFRDVVLARATRTAAEYARYDANYVGGDINAGRAGLYQAALGPVPRWSRYRTPLPGTYLCSSSTPPGGGVHGMCGMNAAREALRTLAR